VRTAAFLAVVLAASILSAQVVPASLQIEVTDPSGVPLPDSQVVLYRNDAVIAEYRTDGAGSVTIEVSDVFELEIRSAGYRAIRTTPAQLIGGADYAIAIPLVVGDSSDVEIVELLLDGAVPFPDTAQPSLRGDLPRYDRLFGLRGGINVSGIAEGSSQQWIAASGNVFASSPAAASLIDSVEFSAGFEPYAGVDDSLPPGRERSNGDVYYFHRNDALNARNYFDQPDEPTPTFKYHFFGAQAGGELRTGTFGFVRYWGVRSRQSVTRAATVPDPAQLTGDFSALAEPILDPETGFQFPGNRIPPERLHPDGVGLASLYPAPNVAGSTIQNFRSVGVIDTVADAFGVRIDHRTTASDESSIEIQYSRDTTEDPFNLVTGITNLPGFGVRDALETGTVRMSNTHVFSPFLLHQVDVSVGYLRQPREPLDADPSPAVIVPGLSSVGHATNVPQDRRNRTLDAATVFTWMSGSRTTTFGGGVRHFRFDAFMDLFSRGQYQFNGGSYSGNALANLLLGVPATAMRIQGDTNRLFTTWSSWAFVQHDWRVRPGLDVQAGVRYEYQSPFSESGGRVVNFTAAGSMETSPGRLYSPDRNNWGPRVGIAWSPVPGTVVRAGYGVFFDSLSVGDSLFMLGLNPPFVEFAIETNDPVLPRFDLGNVFDLAGETVPPSVFSASRNLVNPYVQQWNLLVGRSIGSRVDLTVAYTGQRGTHLRRQVNLNQPAAGDAVTLEDRRPFPDFRNIFQFETSASSSSHALDLGAVVRSFHGLTLAAGYRFARSIDDATLISVLPQNSHDLDSERGLSDFDVRHRLTLDGSYTLPTPAWLSAVPYVNGDWRIQWTGLMQSGMPLSAILGTDVSGTGSPIVNRPDLIGDPRVEDPTPERFFNTDAFGIPEFGRFGTSGRNVIPGPGLVNVDVALLRDFRLSERIRGQFRIDAYNVFNRPNFIAPPTMQNFVDSPDFGALFVARSPRVMQLGMQIYW
jgi:hypothetical protein